MQPDIDDLELPRFSRPMGMTIRRDDRTVAGASVGVLPSFSGLLDVRLDETDRPMADLSYLSLTGVVTDAVAGTGGPRDGHDRRDRGSDDESAAEPTVGEVLRADRSNDDDPSADGDDGETTAGEPDDGEQDGRDPTDDGPSWDAPETVRDPATLLDLDSDDWPAADSGATHGGRTGPSSERGGPSGDRPGETPGGFPGAAGPDTTVLDPFHGAEAGPDAGASGADAGGRTAGDDGAVGSAGRRAVDAGARPAFDSARSPFDAGANPLADDGASGERPRLIPADASPVGAGPSSAQPPTGAPGSTPPGFPDAGGAPGSADGPSLTVRRDAGPASDEADDQTPDDGSPGHVAVGDADGPPARSEEVLDPVQWLRDDDAASRRFVDELYRQLDRKAAMERDREGR